MTPRTRRRTYRREAGFLIMLAGAAVRWLPTARLLRWADRPVKRPSRFAASETQWVVWAIEETTAGRTKQPECLPVALAAHAMFRRRGIVSRLCLGVAHDGDRMAAHAWVEVGERPLVVGENAARFARLATFGTK